MELYLADNMKLLREHWKQNQDEFAAMIGMSRQVYSKYENEQLLPKIETLLKIQELCRLPLDDLMHRKITALDVPPVPIENLPYNYQPQIDDLLEGTGAYIKEPVQNVFSILQKVINIEDLEAEAERLRLMIFEIKRKMGRYQEGEGSSE